MILEEIGMLAAVTSRTRAYLQALVKADEIPGYVVLFTDDTEKLDQEFRSYDAEERVEQRYFDDEEPVLFTLESHHIPYRIVDSKDINSDEMAKVIQELPQKYLIYSGYGGAILKPHLFGLGKKFLHIHAGLLPYYRGSTTAYFSILQEQKIGATAIFLSEGIDEGNMITGSSFEIPKEEVDIDYIYEPYIRSGVLLDAIREYHSSHGFAEKKQSVEGAETYYIIHPVLKHLAIKKTELLQRRNEK